MIIILEKKNKKGVRVLCSQQIFILKWESQNLKNKLFPYCPIEKGKQKQQLILYDVLMNRSLKKCVCKSSVSILHWFFCCQPKVVDMLL